MLIDNFEQSSTKGADHYSFREVISTDYYDAIEYIITEQFY